MKQSIFVILLVISANQLFAQIEVFPSNPIIQDSITLIFDASKGNQGLLNCNCEVYMHTGVITTQSSHAGDWKNVVAPWGSTDSNILMRQVGNNMYEARFRIDSFYRLTPTDTVIQLAFVFRDASGQRSGRSSSNGDIFYSINLQSPSAVIDLSHYFDGNEWVLATDKGYVSFKAYSSDVIRFKYQQDAQIKSDSTMMLLDWNPAQPLSVNHYSNYSEGIAGDLKVVVNHNPFEIYYFYKNDSLISEKRPAFTQFNKSGCFLQLEANEIITGTGFRAIDLNLNGQELVFYNQAHFGYSRGTRNANTAIPFFTSSKGYGIFFNNHYNSKIDFGSNSPGIAAYEVNSENLNYFVIGGGNYDNVLKNYNDLTGYQSIPPIWSLGYIQSKYGYETEAEARQVVSSLRQNDYPVDALILDLYWFGDPSTMGNLDWDRSRFPNPKKMIEDFEDDGVKTILITETYFTQNSTHFNTLSSNNYFANTTAGTPFILGGFWAGSAALLDITNENAKEWFWQQYKPHIDMGIAAWWCDLGEPEAHPLEMQHQRGNAEEVHNTYSLEWAKLLHEKYQQEYNSQRLFNLIRSGYAGMQRYSAFPWSGDIQRSFEGLKTQVPITLNMSMSGIPYMHSDLGGFVGGGQDDELYTRWMQLGTFSPIMRAHGTGMPTEPYNFGNNVQPTLKKALNLRYELLPYTYHLSYLNSITARPLALPMNYFHPQNTMLAQAQYQFYWGESIIVAPVLEQGKTTQNVMLPPGRWQDYESPQIRQGNQTINVSAPLNKTPVFVKSGTLLATTSGLKNTKSYVAQELNIKFFKDESIAQSENEYFVDNGLSPNSIDNLQYEKLKFESELIDATNYDLSCDNIGPGFNESPLQRNIQFEIFHHTRKPVTILLGNNSIQVTEDKNDYDALDSVAYYAAASNKLFVKFPWNMTSLKIQVRDTGKVTPPQDPIGINNQTAFTSSQPYPNPFNNSLNMDLDFYSSSTCQITIYNLRGQILFEKEIVGSSNQRQIFSWDGSTNKGVRATAGVYFLKIIHEGRQQTFKVVKF